MGHGPVEIVGNGTGVQSTMGQVVGDGGMVGSWGKIVDSWVHEQQLGAWVTGWSGGRSVPLTGPPSLGDMF